MKQKKKGEGKGRAMQGQGRELKKGKWKHIKKNGRQSKARNERMGMKDKERQMELSRK